MIFQFSTKDEVIQYINKQDRNPKSFLKYCKDHKDKFWIKGKPVNYDKLLEMVEKENGR